MTGRLVVIQEDENGRNTHFQDTVTRRHLTRPQVVAAIEAGRYDNYHVRVINGVKTPCSNPDGKSRNNLN